MVYQTVCNHILLIGTDTLTPNKGTRLQVASSLSNMSVSISGHLKVHLSPFSSQQILTLKDMLTVVWESSAGDVASAVARYPGRACSIVRDCPC